MIHILRVHKERPDALISLPGLVQERRNSIANVLSYVFLALTQRYDSNLSITSIQQNLLSQYLKTYPANIP